MSPSAQQTHLEFVRLAAEEPSSLYFEEFLRSGFCAVPDGYQRRFPGLSRWPGIAGLKRQLNRFAGASDSSRVLIASRSAALMTLAARVLSKTCRNIFTTDLSWPTYQNMLQHEANRSGNRVHVAQFRRSVLWERMPFDELVAHIVREFVQHNCDGLFLPAVDNMGVRLPINEIVTAIRRQAEVRFVVIDAAQAFAHVPVDDCLTVADFTIAGCHKWLRGYFPLGIGFFGRLGTCDLIVHAVAHMLLTGELDDGLLRFCEQLADADLDGYSETVNLGPLFSCCGAAADALTSVDSKIGTIAQHFGNAKLVREICEDGDWRPLMPDTPLRTGIVLLERRDESVQSVSGEAVRRYFQEREVLVTGYDGGIARLSMPRCPLLHAERSLLRSVLAEHRVSTNSRKSGL